MELELKDKRAVVTGSTAGIGLAIAEELAREQVAVTIVGRQQAKVDAAVSQIITGHPEARVKGVVADLTTAVGASQLFQQLPEVDILVNNLGIYEPKPFAEINDDDWLRLFNVNVLSGVRTSRQYLPGMTKRNWGRIIFISSESGVSTPPEMIHYGTTKTAQLAIMRGLAETTKGTGVTVNAVLPGPTRSEGIVEFLQRMSSNPNATPEEAEQEFFRLHRPASLLQRLIEPREVATLIAYLASPLSAATNGASLRVEGGLLRSMC